MKRKKITALLMAATLGTGMISGSAIAADSYKEAEKAALAKSAAQFAVEYGKSLEKLNTENAEKADIKLTLGSAGKALLGLAAPVDIKWLNDVMISDRVSVSGDKIIQMIDFLVNGKKICTLEYYLDYETMDIYVRVPELSDAYLKMNYVDIMNDSVEMSDTGISAETDIAQIYKLMSDYVEKLPTAEAAETLINRYGAIWFDGFTDGEAADEQIEAGGVSQDAAALSGTMAEEGAKSMAGTLLETAKEDQELKKLIEDWTEGSQEYSYDKFIKKIEELQADLKESEDDEAEPEETNDTITDMAEDLPGTLTSKIWVDDKDNIIGREFFIDSDGESTGITVKETAQGDQRGLLAEMTSDGESFAVEGSGTVTDGLLNGEYSFMADGQKVFAVTVSDYDAAAMEKGYLNGTYTLDLSQLADTEGAEFFNNQMVIASFSGDEDNSRMEIDYSSAGAQMANIQISGSKTEFVAYPDTASFAVVYDVNNEDELNAYMAELNQDIIFANLETAGMPGEFMEGIIKLFTGDSGEVYDADDYEEIAETETGL